MLDIFKSCEVFLEQGFLYSVLAIGYYLSYTLLDFPDLTVEGTVVTGAVSYTLLVRAGLNPWLALVAAFVLGCAAGAVTGLLHVRLHIRPLLCGILVSTALISVNLVATVLGMGGNMRGEEALSNVVLGRGNPSLLRTFPANLIPDDVFGIKLRSLVIFFIVALIVKFAVDWYLRTKNGLLLRATGDNAQYTVMLARDPGNGKITGLALGNGLAALCGALLAESAKGANQGMGLGKIIIGLASVIIGLSVFGKIRFMRDTTKVIIGAVIYQACLSAALWIGVPSAYNKLVMAALFCGALVLSRALDRGKGGSFND